MEFYIGREAMLLKKLKNAFGIEAKELDTEYLLVY